MVAFSLAPHGTIAGPLLRACFAYSALLSIVRHHAGRRENAWDVACSALHSLVRASTLSTDVWAGHDWDRLKGPRRIWFTAVGHSGSLLRCAAMCSSPGLCTGLMGFVIAVMSDCSFAPFAWMNLLRSSCLAHYVFPAWSCAINVRSRSTEHTC